MTRKQEYVLMGLVLFFIAVLGAAVGHWLIALGVFRGRL